MPLYLIQHRTKPFDKPWIFFGHSAEDACRLVGLDPAQCDVKDITHRALSPRSINNSPLTPDFLSTTRSQTPDFIADAREEEESW